MLSITESHRCVFSFEKWKQIDRFLLSTKAFSRNLVYGGPEVTFSHSDFYKVNEIVFKPLLFDFSKVERVLCSSLSCSTLVMSNSFVFKPFLFDFGKVERVLCSSLSCSTFVKVNTYFRFRGNFCVRLC